MKHILAYINLFFIACIIAGASACGDNDSITTSFDKPASKVLFTLDSFTINARDTGIVNNSNYREWVTQRDSNIYVEFDAVISSDTGNTVKYAEIILMQNSVVNFYFQRYNENINGHHAFAVVEPFDLVIFYIKIYNNYSLPAYIRLTNITITRL